MNQTKISEFDKIAEALDRIVLRGQTSGRDIMFRDYELILLFERPLGIIYDPEEILLQLETHIFVDKRNNRYRFESDGLYYEPAIINDNRSQSMMGGLIIGGNNPYQVNQVKIVKEVNPPISRIPPTQYRPKRLTPEIIQRDINRLEELKNIGASGRTPEENAEYKRLYSRCSSRKTRDRTIERPVVQ